MIKQNILWGIFILFVPSPWFWTVKNWDFLSFDYYYDDDNDDVNNYDYDDKEDNNTYGSTECRKKLKTEIKLIFAHQRLSGLLYVDFTMGFADIEVSTNTLQLNFSCPILAIANFICFWKS